MSFSNDLIHLFTAAVALAAALALISVWAPRKLWVRLSAVVIAGLFMPAAYASLGELLSRPKPVSLEWARSTVPQATVIGANLREGEAIYLWLQVAGVDEPRSYVMPWNRKLAQQLYEARQKAAKQGMAVVVRRPFEASLDESEPKFYAQPQERPPLKPSPAQAPVLYPHPRTDS